MPRRIAANAAPTPAHRSHPMRLRSTPARLRNTANAVPLPPDEPPSLPSSWDSGSSSSPTPSSSPSSSSSSVPLSPTSSASSLSALDDSEQLGKTVLIIPILILASVWLTYNALFTQSDLSPSPPCHVYGNPNSFAPCPLKGTVTRFLAPLPSELASGLHTHTWLKPARIPSMLGQQFIPLDGQTLELRDSLYRLNDRTRALSQRYARGGKTSIWADRRESDIVGLASVYTGESGDLAWLHWYGHQWAAGRLLQRILPAPVSAKVSMAKYLTQAWVEPIQERRGALEREKSDVHVLLETTAEVRALAARLLGGVAEVEKERQQQHHHGSRTEMKEEVWAYVKFICNVETHMLLLEGSLIAYTAALTLELELLDQLDSFIAVSTLHLLSDPPPHGHGLAPPYQSASSNSTLATLAFNLCIPDPPTSLSDQVSAYHALAALLSASQENWLPLLTTEIPSLVKRSLAVSARDWAAQTFQHCRLTPAERKLALDLGLEITEDTDEGVGCETHPDGLMRTWFTNCSSSGDDWEGQWGDFWGEGWEAAVVREGVPGWIGVLDFRRGRVREVARASFSERGS